MADIHPKARWPTFIQRHDGRHSMAHLLVDGRWAQRAGSGWRLDDGPEAAADGLGRGPEAGDVLGGEAGATAARLVSNCWI